MHCIIANITLALRLISLKSIKHSLLRKRFNVLFVRIDFLKEILMQNPVNVSSDSDEAKHSWSAKICLSVASGLLGVGVAALFNAQRYIAPVSDFLVSNQLSVCLGILSIAIIFVYVRMISKSDLLLRLNFHLVLFSGIVALSYFLSVGTWFGGEPPVSVWAPIFLLGGAFLLALCGAKHKKGNVSLIHLFSDHFILAKFILILFLGFAMFIMSMNSVMTLARELHPHFKSLHPGETNVAPEIVHFMGWVVECSIKDDIVKCDYPDSENR
jgi:hypothetical protein